MLYDIINQAARLTSQVLIGFSCGKDSIACMELARPRFKRIAAYFMYVVPDLSFQENFLRYIENKYDVEIIRHPHWVLGQILSSSVYRPHSQITLSCPMVDFVEVEDEMKERASISWALYGHRRQESLERQAMLKHCGGIDFKTRRCYPLMDWTKNGVLSFLRARHIPLPKDYEIFSRSFDGFWPDNMHNLKKHYPDDYAKIKRMFPHVEAAATKHELGYAH